MKGFEWILVGNEKLCEDFGTCEGLETYIRPWCV